MHVYAVAKLWKSSKLRIQHFAPSFIIFCCGRGKLSPTFPLGLPFSRRCSATQHKPFGTCLYNHFFIWKYHLFPVEHRFSYCLGQLKCAKVKYSIQQWVRFRECEIGLDALSWDAKTIKGAALIMDGPKWALQCWTAFAKCSQENISSLLTCIFLNKRKKERSCSLKKKKKRIYGISFLFSVSSFPSHHRLLSLSPWVFFNFEIPPISSISIANKSKKSKFLCMPISS